MLFKLAETVLILIDTGPSNVKDLVKWQMQMQLYKAFHHIVGLNKNRKIMHSVKTSDTLPQAKGVFKYGGCIHSLILFFCIFPVAFLP